MFISCPIYISRNSVIVHGVELIQHLNTETINGSASIVTAILVVPVNSSKELASFSTLVHQHLGAKQTFDAETSGNLLVSAGVDVTRPNNVKREQTYAASLVARLKENFTMCRRRHL